MIWQWQHIMRAFYTCNFSCGVRLGSNIRLFSYMLLTKLCAPLSCGVSICAHQGFQSLTHLGYSVKRKVVVFTTVFTELAGSSTSWSWHSSIPFFFKQLCFLVLSPDLTHARSRLIHETIYLTFTHPCKSQRLHSKVVLAHTLHHIPCGAAGTHL